MLEPYFAFQEGPAPQKLGGLQTQKEGQSQNMFEKAQYIVEAPHFRGEPSVLAGTPPSKLMALIHQGSTWRGRVLFERMKAESVWGGAT